MKASRTGNSAEVLKELFNTTKAVAMGGDDMNKLVVDYTGSTRFVNRCKDMTVIRWLYSDGTRLGRIPIDELMEDWADIGLISATMLKESLIVRRYEQAIEKDATIKRAMDEMATLFGVSMTKEDAIFNGLKGEV